MASFSPLIDQLITALRRLPGVGPKSAQRMAFHLLDRDRDSARFIAETLQKSCEQVHYCQRCRILCEEAECGICQSNNRDQNHVCVVESPADVMAIERTGRFRGVYFVLRGHLSPLDLIGPEEIGVPQLESRLATGHVQEVILATNPTVEGEATAYYLSERIKALGIKVTRIAYGVPFGGELEYLDDDTLARALAARERL